MASKRCILIPININDAVRHDYRFCGECAIQLAKRKVGGPGPQNYSDALIEWPHRTDDVSKQHTEVVRCINASQNPRSVPESNAAREGMPRLGYALKRCGRIEEDGTQVESYRDVYHPLKVPNATSLLDYNTYSKLHFGFHADMVKEKTAQQQGERRRLQVQYAGLRRMRVLTVEHMWGLQPDSLYGSAGQQQQVCAEHAGHCNDYCRATCAEARSDIAFQLGTLSYYSFSSSFYMAEYVKRVNKRFDEEEQRLRQQLEKASVPMLLGKIKPLPLTPEEDVMLQILENAGFVERVLLKEEQFSNCVAIFLHQSLLQFDRQWTDVTLFDQLPRLIAFLGGSVPPGNAHANVSVDDLKTQSACSVRSLLDASLSPLDMPTADTPPGLKVELRDYQKMELRWMMDRETDDRQAVVTPIHLSGGVHLYFCSHTSTLSLVPPAHTPPGGILAAEMGLGKTITMAGLFLANPPRKPSLALEALLTKAYNESDPRRASLRHCGFVPLPASACNKPRLNTTLVIVPTSLIAQWALEMKNKTNLKFIVLTGSADRHELAHICSCDVAFISTATLTHRVTQGRSSAQGPKICNLHKSLAPCSCRRKPLSQKS